MKFVLCLIKISVSHPITALLCFLASNDTRPEVYRQRDLPPTANRGGMVGVMTSGWSVQAALGSADACRLAGRSPRRSDFRQTAGMSADGPTPRKSRARPAWISPAVRVPGGRQGAAAARPGTRAGSVEASIWLSAQAAAR